MTDKQTELYLSYHNSKNIEERYKIAKEIIVSLKDNPIQYYWENTSTQILQNEVWLPLNISGLRKYFIISSLGRLKRLFRYVGYRNGNPKRWEEKIIKPSYLSNKTRLRFSVYVKSENYRITPARAIALTFIKNRHRKPCVNHIDGNPLNSHYLNLEWVTYSENEQHSFNVLGKKLPKKRGKENPFFKGGVRQCTLKNKLVAEFEIVDDAAKLGHDKSHIYDVMNGKRKTHHGFIWKRIKKVNNVKCA